MRSPSLYACLKQHSKSCTKRLAEIHTSVCSANKARVWAPPLSMSVFLSSSCNTYIQQSHQSNHRQQKIKIKNKISFFDKNTKNGRNKTNKLHMNIFFFTLKKVQFAYFERWEVEGCWELENELAFKEQKERKNREPESIKKIQSKFLSNQKEKSESLWNGGQCYYNLENVIEDSQFSIFSKNCNIKKI